VTEPTSATAACPWCRGSGLIAPSPFAPEAEKPEPWPDLLARAPWGYPPDVADRYRAILAPSPCPRCRPDADPPAPAPAEAVCDLEDEEPFRLSG
jgi:hypothetical protein